MRPLSLIAGLALCAAPLSAAEFQMLEGHGGPVRAVAVDGQRALTGGFDYSVGLWDIATGEARWLEGHEAAVVTVIFAGEGRAASGGDDFTVRVWDLESGEATVFEGHTGKVAGLAASGDTLASASWDGTVRLWDMAARAPLGVLEGHGGNVNDVVFAEGGAALYSASYDGTIRRWDIATGESRIVVRHGFGINTLAIDEARGWLVYGAQDGGTRAIELATGETLADLTLERRPVLAIARRPDGSQVAVADGQGFIMVVDTADWSIIRDFHAVVRGPVWALAYAAEGDRVFAGGIDDTVFAWPLDGDPSQLELTAAGAVGKPLEEMGNGERQFAQKCSICHTLTPGSARRAGPSLYRLFGRRAGTLPDYSYSPALRDAGFVWSAETIDKLFEIGPEYYTPGSKMPMQQIGGAADRQELIAYLQRMTSGGNQ